MAVGGLVKSKRNTFGEWMDGGGFWVNRPKSCLQRVCVCQQQQECCYSSSCYDEALFFSLISSAFHVLIYNSLQQQ